MKRELIFLAALWKANLQAAMEYRAAFITQMVFMMINNTFYFAFWVVFFNRFEQVRGWELRDMFILYGIVASGVGLGSFLFGNMTRLSEIISGGGLDYYLSLPRPVLLHTLASRSSASGLGDFIYGILSFLAAGAFRWDALARFAIGTLAAMCIFVSFMVLVHSLAFWVGSAQMLSQQAFMAVITFAIYPTTLFEGGARLLLFTVIPAGLVGALPAEFVRSFAWDKLALLAAAAVIFLALALLIFRQGLRRYESGSAIQVQI